MGSEFDLLLHFARRYRNPILPVAGLAHDRIATPLAPEGSLPFELVVATVAMIAGGLASVAGFGIGSLLTPVFALDTGMKVAVAAVGVPHLIGTALRFWQLRGHVDRTVLFGFGVASGLGGLLGALAHTRLASRPLVVVFGCLLVLAGLSELTGWMERVRWGRIAAWIAGVLSGALGGLVGNQGSIRSAAMLGFQVPKESFVATATAVALFVDAARLPVYFATQWRDIAGVWSLVLTATMGVIVGTLLGRRVLRRIPQRAFRRTLAVLLIVLGWFLIAGE